MSIKNFFNHFRFVSKKKYDELDEKCHLYENNWYDSDATLERCIEENHRLRDEAIKLHDNLMMERNRKPRPTIVKKELRYSLSTPEKYVEVLKDQAKEELLHDVETFIREEEMDPGRVRFSIALFPIEDKRFM